MEEFFGFIFIIVIIGVCVNECYLKPKQLEDDRHNDVNGRNNWLHKNKIIANNQYSYFNSNNTITCEYILDKEKRIIVVSDTCPNYTVIPFSEITGCELLIDSHSGGGVGGAIVGGIIAGGAGAIIGATSGKNISSYKVAIYRNNIDNPQYLFTLVNESTSSNTEDVKQANAFAQNVVASIHSVLSMQKSNTSQQSNNTSSKVVEIASEQVQQKAVTKEADSDKDKLIKLKDLLDNGLITKEEYNQKRSDILNSL